MKLLFWLVYLVIHCCVGGAVVQFRVFGIEDILSCVVRLGVFMLFLLYLRVFYMISYTVGLNVCERGNYYEKSYYMLFLVYYADDEDFKICIQ